MKVERKDFGKVIRRISSHQWSCTHSNALVKKQGYIHKRVKSTMIKETKKIIMAMSSVHGVKQTDPKCLSHL